MKIAVVTFEDLNDIKLWASIPFFVIKHLRERGHEVHLVHQIPSSKIPFRVYLKRIWYNHILRKRLGIYRYERLDEILKSRAIPINKQLANIQPDLVLCFFCYQTAYIHSRFPVVLWTDATFNLLNQHYPSYKDFCLESVKQSNKVEKQVFQQAKLIITSSHWAKQSMIADYQISSDKINIIPFGANLDVPKQQKPLFHQTLEKIHLLFVGFDTDRKGLKRVMQVLTLLNKEHSRYVLDLIGPLTQPAYTVRDDVNFVGRLNKDVREDAALLIRYYQEAHLFVLLPEMEAYGIVFCEAAAYGIPIISNAVGGIDEIIQTAINGYKFDKDTPDEIIANQIEELFNQPDLYFKLRESTMKDYAERLNWYTAIEKFETSVNQLINYKIES